MAAVSGLMPMHDGNIFSPDHYVRDSGLFFMRLEVEGEGFGFEKGEFDAAFAPLARRHQMDWSVSYTNAPKRMAILVSRYDHCLIDLLWRPTPAISTRRYRLSRITPTSERASSLTGSPSTTCRSRKRPRPSRSRGCSTSSRRAR